MWDPTQIFWVTQVAVLLPHMNVYPFKRSPNSLFCFLIVDSSRSRSELYWLCGRPRFVILVVPRSWFSLQLFVLFRIKLGKPFDPRLLLRVLRLGLDFAHRVTTLD